jgi:long-chain acyl-CoA synthetase
LATDAPETVEQSPKTIAMLPFFASGRFPKSDCIGRCTRDGITYTSSPELLDIVRDLSLGLSDLGVARGDRVALVSESRPEWLFADFAILAAGAVTTPIYPTLPAAQVAFILRDSEASVAIVSNRTQLDKVKAVEGDLPSLRAIVMLDRGAEALAAGPVPVTTLAEVVERGHRRILDGWGVGRAFRDEARRVQPSDVATIIYTSGTTGEPKGVALTHGNLAANLSDLQRVLPVSHEDVALSFLPLCHAFERMVSYLYLATGVSMVFAESIDTIDRDLKLVRPTVMTGVPRVFEKLYERVLARGRERTGLARAVFEWSVKVADARGRRLTQKRPLSVPLRIKSQLADRKVFSLVRAGVGGRMRFAVSGSAPLREEIGRFFYGVGLPILEGYGLTETSPVLSVMPLDDVRFGTVGPPLPSVELRIAPDGEVLARGPNVMSGYYKRPADTAAALRDGWFHTGDLGTLDARGYLKLTGRKKELLVTSGGKKISPQPIENALRADDLIAEAVLIADGRRFPSAILVPNFVALCRAVGAPRPADSSTAAALVRRTDVVLRFQQVVDRLNVPLAQFERIKKFVVLADEFSVASGELTPTLKVKRGVVEERYRDRIEAMYEKEPSP